MIVGKTNIYIYIYICVCFCMYVCTYVKSHHRYVKRYESHRVLSANLCLTLYQRKICEGREAESLP